jgi:hypothetical protein
MSNKIYIGKIHPKFFTTNKMLRTMDVEFLDSTIEISTKLFKVTYEDGYLVGDSEYILKDFKTLVDQTYGHSLDRETAWESFKHLNTIHKNVLNIGICVLEDSISGWDGAINSVWYDEEAPVPLSGFFASS